MSTGTVHQKNLGIFMGQSKTHLVLGKIIYKIRNKHITTDASTPSDLKCAALHWSREEPEQLTELEQLYYDFCEKAFSIISCNPTLQGGYHPAGINFPDFIYEIIPSKILIE